MQPIAGFRIIEHRTPVYLKTEFVIKCDVLDDTQQIEQEIEIKEDKRKNWKIEKVQKNIFRLTSSEKKKWNECGCLELITTESKYKTRISFRWGEKATVPKQVFFRKCFDNLATTTIVRLSCPGLEEHESLRLLGDNQQEFCAIGKSCVQGVVNLNFRIEETRPSGQFGYVVLRSGENENKSAQFVYIRGELVHRETPFYESIDLYNLSYTVEPENDVFDVDDKRFNEVMDLTSDN